MNKFGQHLEKYKTENYFKCENFWIIEIKKWVARKAY